jgi:hypothetical protein
MKAGIDKVKDKIKKLFALSKSSNANEAALALEMVQKLMAEYGVKRNEVGEFIITQENIDGNSGKHPPKYEMYLAREIAAVFGCWAAYGVAGRIQKYFYGYDCNRYSYDDPKYGQFFLSGTNEHNADKRSIHRQEAL